MNVDEAYMGKVKVGKSLCYMVSDGVVPLKTVSFINKQGMMISENYNHLHEVEFTDRCARFNFSRKVIEVYGRNLAQLSNAVAAHRLVYLRECNAIEEPDIEKPFIEKVQEGV